jgi:23S rRNA pseudouridine1911/1915/1917 synthase
MQTFIVRENTELFDYLQKALHGIKRTTLKNYLRFEAIFVNGKPVTRFDHPLRPGDQIMIQRDKEQAQVERLKSDLKIIYEDDAVLVIDKPSGLLTIATDKVKDRTAFYQAYEYLKTMRAASSTSTRGGRNEKPARPLFIVHRLDRDASGLLIFAKTLEAKIFLQENWHEFSKKYYAVVEGTPRDEAGEIASYLKENQILRVFSSKEPTPGAKMAVTRYRVIKKAAKRSLLEVTLQTGRKHQIRVHMADIGHPILGDKDYGNASLSKRLALHAFFLSVNHPVTKKRVNFQTELPQELDRLLKG